MLKFLLSWLLASSAVGGTIYVATPRCDDSGSELHRHMDRCPTCAGSPFRCPEARRLSLEQAPWPGDGFPAPVTPAARAGSGR